MRLSSLYKFYQKHFRYAQSTNKKRALAFAFAIENTIKVLQHAYTIKSDSPINQYYDLPHNHSLAVNFIRNAEKLAYDRTSSPFTDLDYYDTNIHIDGHLLSTKRHCIIIPCQYIVDRKNCDIILLTFGQPININNEISALVGLVKEFTIGVSFPKNIKTLTYWNLANGTESSVDLRTIIPEKRENLIKTLNTF